MDPQGDAVPQAGSLQARFGKVLHVNTEGPGLERTPSALCNDAPLQKRSIRQVSSVLDLYDIGKEVMPSTHSYMKVCFATRKKDGMKSVVKVRFKPHCFRSREDERSWRHNTEFLLNMPENSGIARLHEVVEDGKAFYIVMEKVEGRDLFEILEHEGKVTVDVSREIMRQLLQSLVHLHSHNAVHKDLKLENVMIDGTLKGFTLAPDTPGSVKVIDFDTLEQWTPNSSTSKDVVGTDQYIAQEAYVGKYSPLSDIFAIGVIAYRLLTGKFPFHDELFDDEAGENWVGSPKMAQIRRRLRVAKVDFSLSVFEENPEARDIIKHMLAYNELLRPTASAALAHAWFNKGPPGTTSFAKTPYRYIDEDLLDDGVVVAQEAILGKDRLQAILRG